MTRIKGTVVSCTRDIIVIAIKYMPVNKTYKLILYTYNNTYMYVQLCACRNYLRLYYLETNMLIEIK